MESGSSSAFLGKDGPNIGSYDLIHQVIDPMASLI